MNSKSGGVLMKNTVTTFQTMKDIRVYDYSSAIYDDAVGINVI